MGTRGNADPLEVPDLPPHHPEFRALTRLVKKAEMGPWVAALLRKMAEFQMRHPELAARFSRV